MEKIIKKYVRSIKEMLKDSKLTTGYKASKCAEIRKFFEDNKKSKLVDYEIYLNVCFYANLNQIQYNGWDGKL